MRELTVPSGTLRDREARAAQLSALYELTARLQRAVSEHEIHDAALDAIVRATNCARASILLFDEREVMCFAAWRGLSDEYRRAVQGHTPWRPGDTDAQPFGIADIDASDLDESLKNTIRREGIRALAFVPLIGTRKLVGKFMMYHDAPHDFCSEQLEIALAIAAHVALGIERCRAEASLRDSEQRLRIALEAGRMGPWEWDVATNRVTWSAALETLHGLAPGSFEGTFEAFRRDIHPDDWPEVEARIRRTLEDGEDHHIEYRILLPGPEVRWVEGRGRLYRDAAGRPVRMVGVCADITERKRSESRLRESDRRKDEFIAMLSHELRNPLAPLRSGLELMRLQDSSESVRQVHSMMERQVSHLVRLVDDLLESSRISSGLLELQRARVTVAEVLRSAIEASEPLLKERGHRLQLEIPQAPIWVEADSVRLSQCFSNLLNNAARYTADGGRIVVRVVADGAVVRIAVCDNGAGFSAETRGRMFEMFSRGPGSGGLGIGLALVRKLVEMHGGTVEAHSEGEGRGSEFTVTLPVVASPTIGVDAPPTNRLDAPLRVVVADDNRDGAESLAALLGMHGHEVRIAFDGLEAVRATEAFEPHVVLLDIGMPLLDGYGAAREIRENPRTAGVRIVAVTGWGQEHDLERARQAGFDAHLVKPVDFESLRTVLEDAAAAASGITPAGG